MSPPRATARLRADGTTCVEASDRGQVERLIRVAHVVLNNCGYQMSANKVVRIVRRYADAHTTGLSFFYYFANMIRLDADQQRAMLTNPDVARVIAYADPTGETAVRNVMRNA